MQFLGDLRSSFVRKQPKKEQKRKLLDCCIPVWLRTSGVDRACEVRDQLQTPTRHRQWLCNEKAIAVLLGAVPRYWKVVASCFQNVGFVENTSAPLALRARIFQPIILLFFCFLALEIVCKTVSQISFIPSQNLVAFKRRQNLLKKAIFGRSQTFKQLPVRNLKFWDTLLCGRTSGVS